MPSAQLIFRSVCGQFASVFENFILKRAVLKIAMRTVTLKLRTRADGVNVGLLLSLLYFGNLLALSGDIELNPGPPKMNNTRQTRLTSNVRSSRRCSMDNTSPEVPLPTQQSIPVEPTVKDVMELLCSMNKSWSEPWQTKESVDSKQPAAKATEGNLPTTEEPTSKDFTSILDSINCKFAEIQKSVVDLTKVCKDIQNEILNLKEEMSELKNEQVEMQKTNSLLLDRIEELEKKTDDIEFKSKKGNLIFHGVTRKRNETNVDCKEAINELLTEKLDISESVQFENVFRVNNKIDSPILASFASLQQREMILKARHKLKGSTVFVSEDFPMRIRQIRRKLIPFLKEARKVNNKAFIVYDHLIIDGKKFYLSLDGLKERNLINC